MGRSRGNPINDENRRKRKRKEGDEIHLPSSMALVSASPFHQQKTVCTIAAHEGTLAAITFNSTGSKLASASEKVSALPSPSVWGFAHWLPLEMPRELME